MNHDNVITRDFRVMEFPNKSRQYVRAVQVRELSQGPYRFVGIAEMKSQLYCFL